MKIEATAQEIRALLALAAVDARAQELSAETYRARREAARAHVGNALLEPYESLLEAAREPAIVPIVNGTCSGCHVRLATMIDFAAGRSPSVHRCSHCQRLVYAAKHFSPTPPPEPGGPARDKKASSLRRVPVSSVEPS